MRKKVFLLFTLFCIMAIQAAYAQSFSVKGRVTSAEDGEGMVSLTIMQKGTANGVVTDFDGNYDIQLNGVSEATLVFTYVGYETQEHIVTAATKELDVVMAPEQVAMEEVVVVAYGTVRREAATGSVTSVKNEQLAQVPATSVDKMLAGKMAGVTITSGSGQPGSTSTIH